MAATLPNTTHPSARWTFRNHSHVVISSGVCSQGLALEKTSQAEKITDVCMEGHGILDTCLGWVEYSSWGMQEEDQEPHVATMGINKFTCVLHYLWIQQVPTVCAAVYPPELPLFEGQALC